MANSKDVGNITEAIVIAELVKQGKKVLTPFGDNLRYDILVDNENGTFTRIQCKTARMDKAGSVLIQTCSSQYHRNGKKESYKGQADYFYAFCPQNGKLYAVPVNDVGNTQVVLRITEPKKRNQNSIKWAKDYEVIPP